MREGWVREGGAGGEEGEGEEERSRGQVNPLACHLYHALLLHMHTGA